ncbi:MAG: VOC family protein [Promethearchaeota archaeon]
MNLSPLINIGAVVPDAEGAYQLLQNLFDAQKIQEDIANIMSNSFTKVLHVGVGDIVLQFIEPLSKEGIWHTHIQTKGSGIHHLTYYVENIDETIEVMKNEAGVEPLATLDIDWGKIFPSNDINPKANKIYIMNTMAEIGFHLALLEKPVDFPKTRYPTGLDKLIGDASTMLHIELTVDNNERIYNFLHNLFGTELVEKEFSNMLDSDFMRIIHINLSNIVLQYCQPVEKVGTWYELLQKNGPYVHNLNWSVDDIKETVKKFKQEKIPKIFRSRLGPDSPPFYMMNTLDKLGFHLENGQAPKTEEGYEFTKNFLFIDFKKD